MASKYSWESFIRIHGGEPGARDVFENLIADLLRTENPDKENHIVKASRGDIGIDIYLLQEAGIDIYLCKFFMGSMTSSRWRQVKDSLIKVMEPKGVKVLRCFLCMPREMQNEDIKKWVTIKKEIEKVFPDIVLRYIDGNEIISRLQKCDRVNNTALMEKYFYENWKKHFTNKDLVIPITMSKESSAQGGTYVQREDLLSKIEEGFKTERIVILSGMGGCGKSELARAYGYEHRNEYEEIFWLTCDGEMKPNLMSLMSKAELLVKIEREDVKHFSNKVLIIIDNCNTDYKVFFEDLYFGTNEAHVLVTTRLRLLGDFFYVIPVESDDPETFAYAVFESNYSKKPRWGRAKTLCEEDSDAVRAICAAVQYNTMLVSLIAIRLREYSNLSISECAKKILLGIGEIAGQIKYVKDQRPYSAEMKDILHFLFIDIITYPFSNEEKAVLTVLSLAPTKWYEIKYILFLLGDMSNEYAVRKLLDIGCLQGKDENVMIHPLIAQVIADNAIIIRDSDFYDCILKNYLSIPEEYFKKDRILINAVLNRSSDDYPNLKIAVMLLINHEGYASLFKKYHPDIQAAYFVYVNLNKERFFEYRDLLMGETGLLEKSFCMNDEQSSATLLTIFNTGVIYTLDLSVDYHGLWIKDVPSYLCKEDKFLGECLLGKVDAIGDYAFIACSNLKGELHLPESVTSIGNSAFAGCKGLCGELSFPASLTSIGDNAFEECSGLSGELHFPDSLTCIGNYAFSGCSSLCGDVYFPVNLMSIGGWLFYGCSSLSGELHLPMSLTRIGEFSFAGCCSLRGELRLPESVTSIGNSAFAGCKGLCGELRFPASLTSIGDSAFEECSGLTGELHFPDSLTSIGNYAFSGCIGFCGNVNLPANLMSLGGWLFYGCSGLNGELHLPMSLTRIGEFAFAGCRGLSGELYFPENVKKIGDSAFEDCSSLSGELHLPESLTRIGEYAFSSCKGFSGELYLPSRLESIGAEAFKGCYGMTLSSHMPDTIEKIGIGAFDGPNKSVDMLCCPAAIWNSKLAREIGISELENEQDGLIGRYYIRIEGPDIVTSNEARKESTTGVSLRIPSIYSYVSSIKKDKLYYSRLERDNTYDVLKATGSQSRRDYAKQLSGNHSSKVLVNWYTEKKVAAGDYVILSIYDDNEIVLQHVSKNEKEFIQKYGLDGHQGNLTFNNEIKETREDFRLVSLVVRDGQQLIMDYSFFSEEMVKPNTEPVTTIIVGENGSGKSYTLKILSEIFCAVENDNSRSILTHTYYKLVYTLMGKRISVEIAQNRVGIHDGKRLVDIEQGKKLLPNKVLALAFMLNDKYIFRREISENSIYEYLGVRGASNAAWTSALGNRVAENIITLVSEGSLWRILKRLSEYLHIDSKISITVDVKEKEFIEHGFSFISIQKYILDGLQKESIENSNSQRIITAKNKVKENIERYSNILYGLLHASVIKNGDIYVCEMIFDEKDTDFKIEENEKIYKAVRDLYILQIVSDITLYIYRDGQKYMFDEVSSGEKNILYAILNIAGHIEKNSLIMIDEPEISLHPNWQMMYISLLKTAFKDYSTCHFLIATHSPYMVSDLNPDSSSLIALYNNHGERKMHTIDYSTYSWSVENILYNVFHTRTTRNYYFEMDLRELIRLIGDNKDKDITRIKELYDKLSRYVFDQKDPLRLILKQVEEQFIYAES